MSVVPSVSVILPTHNRAQFLPRAIASVLAQGFSDFELIVVDDASNDATPHLMQDYRDERIRYLRLDCNVGPGVARNRAIEVAHGEWLAFQDSDDEWLAGKLQVQVEYARSLSSDYCAVGSTLLRIVRDRVERVIWPILEQKDRGEVDLDAFLTGSMAYLQSLIIRRKSFVAVGGFDESLPVRSDVELCMRLVGIGRFAALAYPLALSWETPGSVSLQHGRRAACTRTILARHVALLDEHPNAFARWHYDLARNELLFGNKLAGLKSLLISLRMKPRALRTWLLLVLGLLPAGIIARVITIRHRLAP
jgi:glycosyltransferase involved in cell wall biosynthesis